jgi:hypothetical protein
MEQPVDNARNILPSDWSKPKTSTWQISRRLDVGSSVALPRGVVGLARFAALFFARLARAAGCGGRSPDGELGISLLTEATNQVSQCKFNSV